MPDVAGVQNAAADEVKKFLEKIPDGYETYYGFKDRSEFTKIDIGIPLLVYTLDPDSVDETVDGSKRYLKSMNEWRVPVIVDNEYRTLITVVKSGEKYQAVDFGGAVLAKRIGTIHGSHYGYVNSIVRIYSIQSDYILADSAGVKGEDGTYIPVNPEQNDAGSLKKSDDTQLSRTSFLSVICKKHLQLKSSVPARKQSQE
jgi:hypothetical protein